jgi:hypothetical protein
MVLCLIADVFHGRIHMRHAHRECQAKSRFVRRMKREEFALIFEMTSG